MRSYARLSTILSILILTAISGAEGQSANMPGAGSVSELVGAFRTAHDRRDLDGMLDLFCWDQVTPEIRQGTEKDVEESFDDDISNLKTTTDHPTGQVNEFVRDGVGYGLNLTVTEELVMETAMPKSGPKTTYYPIGMKNGRYFIALMASSNGGEEQPGETGRKCTAEPPAVGLPQGHYSGDDIDDSATGSGGWNGLDCERRKVLCNVQRGGSSERRDRNSRRLNSKRSCNKRSGL
jgi:hypothetical protein